MRRGAVRFAVRRVIDRAFGRRTPEHRGLSIAEAVAIGVLVKRGDAFGILVEVAVAVVVDAVAGVVGSVGVDRGVGVVAVAKVLDHVGRLGAGDGGGFERPVAVGVVVRVPGAGGERVLVDLAAAVVIDAVAVLVVLRDGATSLGREAGEGTSYAGYTTLFRTTYEWDAVHRVVGYEVDYDDDGTTEYLAAFTYVGDPDGRRAPPTTPTAMAWPTPS